MHQCMSKGAVARLRTDPRRHAVRLMPRAAAAVRQPASGYRHKPRSPGRCQPENAPARRMM